MIFRSPHPDVDVPELPLTDYVLGRAADLGDKPALVDAPSGRSLTYENLAGTVRSAAAGLAERGFVKGDVLALFSPNLPEYAVAFHAAASAGGVVTTINSLATAQDIANQLVDSGAKEMLTIGPFMDRAAEAAQKAGIEDILVFGEAKAATPFASILRPGVEPPQVDIDPHRDLAALPYSSGTTGFPKGVMLTHHNLVANVAQAAAVFQIAQDEVLIGVLPFFHIYGMTVIMNLALAMGATIVTMPRFDLEPFLQTVQDHRVTRANVVPPIVLALAKHPAVGGFDLSSLQVVFSGAAPLDATLAESCAARLGCRVIQGYGLTETSPVTHAVPNDWEGSKPGSIGPPIPNTECQVVDWGTGERLGPNEDGEILIRGPQVMRGYLHNPEATARTIDGDGWLRTGDIGHGDGDAWFYVVDRLKELIKYKGYQVPPAELEAVLVAHPR